MNDLLPFFEEQRAEVNTWPDRPRALLSYAYASKVTAEMFAEWGDVDIIIDSGAFTAHNSGKPIDHAAYLRWLGEHAHLIEFAFALDVIGDPLATLDNYRHGMDVLAGAVQLVPTWHIGTSFDVLERYCAEADYVAVGGAVPYYQQQNDLYRLSLRAHDIARANGTRLHGLGMTGRKVMFGLPWASVDSSSWSISARMPFLYLANADGRMVSLNYGRPMPEWHQELVRRYGGDPTGMEDEGFALVGSVGAELARERKLWGTTASARAYMHVEGAKRRATGLPFKVYLAASPRDVPTITEAHAIGSPYGRRVVNP